MCVSGVRACVRVKLRFYLNAPNVDLNPFVMESVDTIKKNLWISVPGARLNITKSILSIDVLGKSRIPSRITTPGCSPSKFSINSTPDRLLNCDGKDRMQGKNTQWVRPPHWPNQIHLSNRPESIKVSIKRNRIHANSFLILIEQLFRLFAWTNVAVVVAYSFIMSHAINENIMKMH